MDRLKLGEGEYRLMELIWQREPLGSGDLVRLCEERIGWKKPTTYTVVKRLCNRGLLKNENAVVSSLIPKSEVIRYESEQVLKKFNGSLPQFLVAFLGDNQLSADDAEEIKQLIDRYREV